MRGDETGQHESSEVLLELARRSFWRCCASERGASEHTVRAYGREVRGFAEYLAETLGEGCADMRKVEHRIFGRTWGCCIERGLTKASVARALAAVRSWFKWLARSG